MREHSESAVDLDLAEAAAWLARLHGSTSEAGDEAFQLWLAESPAHARAYARVVEAWDIIPRAARASSARPETHIESWRPRRRTLLAVASAGVASILVLACFALFQRRIPVYQTSAGEIKSVTLSDGSRVTLDADTRLSVDYGRNERRIRLERGQALFEDVEDPTRPFTVLAGGYQVRVLGTIFDVQSTKKHLAVTLIKGRVDVSQIAQGGGHGTSTPTELSPGERLVVHADGHGVIDHPSLAVISAWQRGYTVFKDVPLGDVIAKLNRNNSTPIRLADPALARIRVSGVFPIADPVDVAYAIASLHNLTVVQSTHNIVIGR